MYVVIIILELISLVWVHRAHRCWEWLGRLMFCSRCNCLENSHYMPPGDAWFMFGYQIQILHFFLDQCVSHGWRVLSGFILTGTRCAVGCTMQKKFQFSCLQIHWLRNLVYAINQNGIVSKGFCESIPLYLCSCVHVSMLNRPPCKTYLPCFRS